MKIQLALAGLATTCLASCGFYQAHQAGEAAADLQALLLGDSKADIRACAGPPQSISRESGSEVWHYRYDAYRHAQMDRDYVGLADVVFTGGEVTDLRFRSNYETNTFGMAFTPNQIRALSLPIFEGC
ncbi:MAG: hypothetical protein GC146_05245 [Limimaricola sp.]|uniref:hypothetical protein n=1 Tax=Limimaricola sp. TaxID=2211665 RepID=UPI001D40CF18|nr:hypothetical protein [Limimaricola sp.]MBI1416612.1 hypothetical protein [Limimaricola sp.]